jgi:hypothetical protein
VMLIVTMGPIWPQAGLAATSRESEGKNAHARPVAPCMIGPAGVDALVADKDAAGSGRKAEAKRCC